MLVIYSICTITIAAWLGINIYYKLDKYDWHYRRLEIWLSFGLKTIFWLPIMIFKPSELITPEFGYRASMLNIDFAETARQRVKFMENPLPCGSVVTYRSVGHVGKCASAVFYFSAAVVEAMAKEINQDQQGLMGMHAAALWTSLRNESVTEPTEVPELLVNFDHIAEGLIEAGHGQVRCSACDKIYSVSELERESIGFPASARSGWIYANFMCPARHSLLLREVMHIMRRMPDD